MLLISIYLSKIWLFCHAVLNLNDFSAGRILILGSYFPAVNDASLLPVQC